MRALAAQRYWTARTQPQFIMLVLSLVLAVLIVDSVGAQSVSLDGSWSGVGSVTFASGEREAVQCRAQYSRSSQTAYLVISTCATASGRATQTATLRHVGANNYRGNFTNDEYGVSGTISVAVNGNRQTVRLNSQAVTGRLELRR
jgi:hypothetical protein